MTEIIKYLDQLLTYALREELIYHRDLSFFRNRLLRKFGISSPGRGYYSPDTVPALHTILSNLCDAAVSRSIIENDTVAARDFFDTELMGSLTPSPSEVERRFHNYEKDHGIQAATDWYYKFSCSTNYIREDRIKRDKKWIYKGIFGDLQITVNLSKPEKDPKLIARMKTRAQRDYPRCLLCRENEGYADDLTYPARQNHRVVDLALDGEPWFLQYSPYVYYSEHCIVVHQDHHPMVINTGTIKKCLDFTTRFPHYFVGSNADLPIVGGSILAHEHFQGGRHHFPIEDAAVFHSLKMGEARAELLEWPLSVIRLRGKNSSELVELFDRIMAGWKQYSNEELEILAETDQPHNTITPIARRKGNDYELDLVLRNNRCNEIYPDGIFHPHAELHHIKKENIGLIEVMGLAVLPGRLDAEMRDLRPYIKNPARIKDLPEELKKHDSFARRCADILRETSVETEEVLRQEMGRVFEQVLTHCGVFKQDDAGRKEFIRFMESIISSDSIV